MPSLYESLGIERNADSQEIRRAYLKLSKTLHPDKGGDPEKFKVIQEAYEVLSDENKRNIYDQTGRIQGEEIQENGGMPFGFPFDLGAMFGMGGGFPFGGGGGGGGPFPQRKRGKKAPPKIHEIHLTLRDFFYGKIMQLKFERQAFCTKCKGEGSDITKACGDCGGSGVVERHISIGPGMHAVSRGPCAGCKGGGKVTHGVCLKCNGAKFSNHEKMMKIDIVPGMKPGESIVFPNECSDHPEYEEPGDVHIIINEADETSTFHRVENDLSNTVGITLRDCLLGCKKVLMGHPAYQNGITVDIPPGTIRGDTVTIAGEGMPCRGTTQRGNLQLIISMDVTPQEKELLRKNQDVMSVLSTLFKQSG
jgi:DnaJ family protein A protein 2